VRPIAIVALLLLTVAAPAHAAPEHAEIAFASDGKLWSSRADGSERRLLGRGDEPIWSPDGSRLAYVHGNEDESQIMLLGAGAITPLRKGVTDASPAWSPDGTQLAFSRFTVRRQRYRTSIVVVDVASRAERVLITQPLFPRFEYVGLPAWSPDGATIAYTHSRIDREHDIRPDIRTVPAGGGTPSTLIRDAQWPAWSPDGTKLAFASIRDRNGTRCSSDECWFAGELYVAAADGSQPKRLTRNEGDDAVPRWSPDGSRILFTSDRTIPEGASAEVYSVAADGSCLTWLTNGTPASGFATWRPDSGSRFDPGSCDPATRAPLVDPPPLPRSWRGLWLGPRYGDRLFSRVENGIAWYDDCARFDRCPTTILLWVDPACRPIRYRDLRAFRLLRVRGALVTYFPGSSRAHVHSGRAVTTVQLGRGRLAAVRRVIRDLRPRNASAAPRRLAPPRLPRALARRLGVRRYTPCSS
jgi:dipeptidyl aminopeptidase/acylaminoacyl peptidase